MATDSKTGRFLKTHGASGTPEFRIWSGIMCRCHSPQSRDYPEYGGRGIYVDERWHRFENFLADLGPRPPGRGNYRSNYSVERKDNNGPYGPDNCKWATQSEQQRNKRTNLRITFNGETKSAAEWIEISGLSKNVFHLRWRRGWGIERILSTPLEIHHKRL